MSDEPLNAREDNSTAGLTSSPPEGSANAFSEEDFFDAFVRRIKLSKDLRSGASVTQEEIAQAIFAKFDHMLFPETLLEGLEDLRTEVQEDLKACIADCVGHENWTEGELHDLRERDPDFKNYCSDALLAIRCLEALPVFVDEHGVDEDGLSFAAQVIEAVSVVNRLKARHDVVPLIFRGLYATDLRAAVDFWESNRDTAKGQQESTWQDELSKRKAILERVVGGKVLLIHEQAHVGAAKLSGAGEKIVDFMLQHSDTRDVTLIEIKTPRAKLLGSVYRGTYPLSSEVSGSVAQVLIQRADLMHNFFQKSHSAKIQFEAYAPKCIVITGHLTDEIGDDSVKARAFELQRQAVSANVSIITFDELYAQFARFNVVY